MDENKCLHCGFGERAYCERCYQALIAENVKLQKIIDEMTTFIHVNEFDDLFSHEYCDGLLKHCKYPDEDGCYKCIKEYFEKKVENEIQKF